MSDIIPWENEGGETEDNERIAAARTKINEWKKEYPAISNLGHTELSLLKQMISAPEEYRRQQFFLICEFLDREDALDHVAAYYEADELGMDTGFNVAYMFACVASNEKGAIKNNRIAAILDSLSHYRFTSNTPKEEAKRTGSNERGPISG